jgi:hypothetical protein
MLKEYLQNLQRSIKKYSTTASTRKPFAIVLAPLHISANSFSS